jgi:hypothetical protein
MLLKAVRSLGLGHMFGEADIYARFALLFAIGVAGIVAFYWSLIATVQILVREAGSGLNDDRTPVAVALAVLLGTGLAPILRFLVSDLPDLLRQTLRDNGDYLLLGVILVISSFVLLLA